MTYTGNIARIQLGSEEVRLEPTQPYAERFLGGRGINSWILFDEIEPGVKPLDPENLLVFGAGPLAGTRAPCSGRMAIGSMNVATGGINFSNSGGHFAPAMKSAGFDHLVIAGRSAQPIYIYIHDGQIEFKEASHLWGQTTWQTQEVIARELGRTDLSFATIGPAGENLVAGGIIIVDRTRAAGGGGLGAVMGSKRVKALVAPRSQGRTLEGSIDFEAQIRQALDKINRSDVVKTLREKGTVGAGIRCMNSFSALPVHNVDDEHWDAERIAKLDYPSLSGGHWNVVKSDQRIECCHNCPIQCGFNVYRVTAGPYAGLSMPAHHANLAFLGTRCGIDDPAAIVKIFEQLSLLGLDNDFIAVVVSWAMDCCTRGILNADLCGFQELTWGNAEAVLELMRIIAHREGFGDLLAQGVQEASETVGLGSEYRAIHCKGQDNLDALRAAKGWALGNVASLCGGRHLDGAPSTEFSGLTPETGQRLYGVPTAGDPTTYEGKGKLVAWTSGFKAAVDSLGTCYFGSICFDENLLALEDYARLFAAASGRQISARELHRNGLQIFNVEKAFNTLHRGFSREDDMPPPIFMQEPIKSGRFRGELLAPENWNRMLDDLYHSHHWDRETSWQTQQNLTELDLTDVFEKLAAHGKTPM